ncbi:hypothetical protein RJ640_023051 [Escallonia rubra]|uniref:Beta-1,3-glucanase n=1 Tax=Escallonia rubra TaxID=112253 RepID=A0AA88R9W9_9ASTE|nr:hypothetical protein RJ640_023051 [Escallonia rubra]
MSSHPNKPQSQQSHEVTNPPNDSKKRKFSDVDVSHSPYFKIRALVQQLRPHVIEVLRTPDFRNCEAANEIRRRVKGIGVNYGLLGDNLPPPDQVIALLKSKNIQKIRIFDPNQDVLNALHGSDISVILGVRNEDLRQLASTPSFATTWVNTNVAPHSSSVKFTYVSAGNEVVGGELSSYVLGAMQNLDAALVAANIAIPVSTTVSLQVLGSSYPPSSGAFADPATMTPIVAFLAEKQSPLLVDAYPYFAYIGDPANIKLEYALFQETSAVVKDGELGYNNLFDAMVDATYAALEKVGGSNVGIVVSESGWPSAGNGDIATKANAQTYVNNLIAHVSPGTGTPKRPGKALETYVFALFNEDLKPGGTEQNFGLYYPDMAEVYPVNFAVTSG